MSYHHIRNELIRALGSHVRNSVQFGFVSRTETISDGSALLEAITNDYCDSWPSYVASSTLPVTDIVRFNEHINLELNIIRVSRMSG